MRPNKIEQGKQYEITIGKNTTIVRVVEIERRVNGQIVFDCMNVKTNKRTTISDPKRFVREIKTDDAKPMANETKSTKSGDKMSGLEAAHKVLVEEARPMKVREITELAQERGYCDLPGLTPSATISSAIQRDIKAKGDASRFIKTDKGMFEAR